MDDSANSTTTPPEPFWHAENTTVPVTTPTPPPPLPPTPISVPEPTVTILVTPTVPETPVIPTPSVDSIPLPPLPEPIFPPIPTPPLPPEPMMRTVPPAEPVLVIKSKKGSGSKVILGVLIFLLISAAGVLGYMAIQGKGLPFNLGRKAQGLIDPCADGPGGCCNATCGCRTDIGETCTISNGACVGGMSCKPGSQPTQPPGGTCTGGDICGSNGDSNGSVSVRNCSTGTRVYVCQKNHTRFTSASSCQSATITNDYTGYSGMSLAPGETGTCSVDSGGTCDIGQADIRINNSTICWDTSKSCTNCAAPPPGVSCNESEVTLSVVSSPVNINSPISFRIAGDASLFIGDNYGGGANGCSGSWDNKSCTSSSTAGTYTWTHTWKHCEGSTTNCSGTCTKNISYTMTGPIATATPRPTAPPIPTATSTPRPTAPPIPTATTTPIPGVISCSGVTVVKKNTTGLANLIPGDTVVITVTSSDTVSDMAIRIKKDGVTLQELFSNSSWTPGTTWQYEYIIPANGAGSYEVQGFIKTGGVWK